MSYTTPFLAAVAAGLLLATAAGAQEPAGPPAADAPAANQLPADAPPADQPAEALPPPAEPPVALPVPSSVPAEVLLRLAREADDVWRVAVLVPASGRFGDRVALTQADLSRRLDRLARSEGVALPSAPSPEARRRAEILRAQPPEAVTASLGVLVRERYPDMIGTIEGWRDGPERAVADALLPPLRAELALAERLASPALTGTSGTAEGSASPR